MPRVSIRFAGRSIVIGPSFRSAGRRAFVLSHRWFTVARCDNNILPADNAILANKEEERGRSLNRPFVRSSIHPFPHSLSVRRGPSTDRRFLIRQTQTDTWLNPSSYVFVGICNRIVSASLLVSLRAFPDGEILLSVFRSRSRRYAALDPTLLFFLKKLSDECWNLISNFSIFCNKILRCSKGASNMIDFRQLTCTRIFYVASVRS